MSADAGPRPILRGQAQPWDLAEMAEGLTAPIAEGAVRAMEIARAQWSDAHVSAARRIVDSADSLGRADLGIRSRLIIADIEARNGSPLRALADVQSILAARASAGETVGYLTARAHFVACVIQFSLGDLPAARVHGRHGIDLLPAGTPAAIRIDHLNMLAAAYGAGGTADELYRRALDLATQSGDTDKSLAIYNNLAYTTWQAGDTDTAAGYVERMLRLAAQHGKPLKNAARDTAAQVYIATGRPEDAAAILAPVVALDPDETALPAAGAHPPAGSNAGVLHTAPYSLPECFLTAAHAYRLLGDLDAAQEAVDRARTIAEERQLGKTAARVLLEQAYLDAARGDWRGAYEQHVAFHEKSVQLHTAEQEDRARVIKAGYDADQSRRDTMRFRELAVRDPLTGLYNRRFIDAQLAELTAQAVAGQQPLSAAIADADFFKRINDECSHDVGDQVLRTMATILGDTVVAPETVGRLGGEEFVILMPGEPAADAARRCEQVRAAIAAHDWRPLVGDIPVTVSIGVSTAPTGQTSPAAILSDADRHLYAAKRSGRNRVVSDLR